jgi:branched-chain amino acid transport system substrate-binding protein
MPQSTAVMAIPIVEQWKKLGVKTYGFLGYSDGYGEAWLTDIKPLADKAGIKLLDTERFARSDTAVTGQALKLTQTNPDAILVVASGSGAAMPHRALVERGYKGKIYQTHGVGNPDFLRVVGKDGNGTLLPIGPMLVYEQLPDSNVVKKASAEYVTKYEQKFGTRTTFGGHLWDAYQLLAKAIPEAAKKAKPGTPQFRVALRDALETSDVVGVHGVFVMNANDHNGLDNRARVIVRIDDGKWVLQK